MIYRLKKSKVLSVQDHILKKCFHLVKRVVYICLFGIEYRLDVNYLKFSQAYQIIYHCLVTVPVTTSKEEKSSGSKIGLTSRGELFWWTFTVFLLIIISRKLCNILCKNWRRGLAPSFRQTVTVKGHICIFFNYKVTCFYKKKKNLLSLRKCNEVNFQWPEIQFLFHLDREKTSTFSMNYPPYRLTLLVKKFPKTVQTWNFNLCSFVNVVNEYK